MIDKGIVKKSFSKAALTYDTSATLQKEVVVKLVSFIEALRGEPVCHGVHIQPDGALYPDKELILDIGCGTGSLMEEAGKTFSRSVFFGCDIAFPMLLRARTKLGKGFNPAAADCEYLPFRDASFDVAASSLTYQWADISVAFKEASRVLKDGGLFAFSTLGPATLNELRACLRSPMDIGFRDRCAVLALLKNAGFELSALETHIIVKEYNDIWGLIRNLKNIGAAPPVDVHDNCLSKGALLKEASRLYSERFGRDGYITATYEVILAAARKI
ncbi:MAG: methyltransferase domain-containing protein [Deltaproteobacteria bacterium]|nr:methyltransferase domain-containing protein [Deltaproteobacteria bacterium]